MRKLPETNHRHLSILRSDQSFDQILGVLMEITQSNTGGIYSLSVNDNALKKMARFGSDVESDPKSYEAWLNQRIEGNDTGIWIDGEEIDREHGLYQLPFVSAMWVRSFQQNEKVLFWVGRQRGVLYKNEDLDLFSDLTAQAGILVENYILRAELEQSVRKIEESHQALVQNEKMAAVGRLMASIAHEVNNPLQAVGNCLELASRKELSSKRREEYLQMAMAELQRLGETVQRMLEFYRPGTVERLPVDINGIITRVLNLVNQPLVDHNIQVTMRLEDHLPRVVAASDLIQQVIFNLVVNAIEVMPQKGYLWIASLQDKGGVLIRIEDSGPGVAESLRSRLFEPFTSAKTGGSGLGLSVSFGIIEAHGGTLRLVPGSGQGACFEVFLPGEVSE
jgi:signal transduction histidine kinase